MSKKHEDDQCPKCGHCRHCGRSGPVYHHAFAPHPWATALQWKPYTTDTAIAGPMSLTVTAGVAEAGWVVGSSTVTMTADDLERLEDGGPLSDGI